MLDADNGDGINHQEQCDGYGIVRHRSALCERKIAGHLGACCAADTRAVVMYLVRHGNGGEDAGEGERDGKCQGKESRLQGRELVAATR